MKGNITENFTWEESIVTNKKIDNNFENEVNSNEIELNIISVAEHIMQPLRNYLKRVIKVNSWYRSEAVNKAVGSKNTSSHRKGEAVDFVCVDLLEAFNWIKDYCLFDQLIWEVGKNSIWVHVSYRRVGINRNQVLISTWNNKGKRMEYKPYTNKE